MIGAGEPALPGISIGHNGTIAFGLTIVNVDQEDLYVYELNPGDPNQYRYQGGWEAMRIIHEQDEVKGEGTRDLELKFTRHGPVISDIRGDGDGPVLAVSMGNLAPGDTAAAGLMALNRAKDVYEAGEAARRITSPVQNLVVADQPRIARRAHDAPQPQPTGDRDRGRQPAHPADRQRPEAR